MRLEVPNFLNDTPKTLAELKAWNENAQKDINEGKKAIKDIVKVGVEWKAHLVERYYNTSFPLREKINLFWQNNFVATYQSVKIPYWIFWHYKSINNFGVGNYKDLVKEMVFSNAVIRYLDNQKNRRGNINENLGRELLELFTLGEGNYTENDIKNTALALAGLTFGQEKGQYLPMLKDNSIKTFMGQKGNFDANDIINIIFEQENTAYFLAEKVLKCFFYDTPSKDLIIKYGDILRLNNFELKPFFQSLFEEECSKKIVGSQIKNPLVFIIQLLKDLNIDAPNYKFIAFFSKNQGMDLYDQPNVKGWKGGQDWLTTQIYNDRHQLIDFIIQGNKQFSRILSKRLERFDGSTIDFKPSIHVENSKNAQTIIEELINKNIFNANEDMLSELQQILTYDFDPKSPNAQQNILSIYQYLAKTPEYQII